MIRKSCEFHRCHRFIACVMQEFSGGTGDDLSLTTLMKIACTCNDFRSALDVANVL